jgi:hypothetical protein
MKWVEIQSEAQSIAGLSGMSAMLWEGVSGQPAQVCIRRQRSPYSWAYCPLETGSNSTSASVKAEARRVVKLLRAQP